jgi:cell division cycle protein 20 (cofactor of APC complex)
MGQLYTANAGAPVARKAHRHVPQTQERILDAPDLVDDYYLNLLDWSCQNTIAIALGKAVYLWNAGSGGVEELCAMPADGDYISSLQWAADGSHLAVGTSDAKVQIWDVTRMKQVRELAGHTNRVSAVAWNGAILSSGGRDSIVCNWDVRVRKDQANVATLRVHEQEVCGLKWSPSGTQLASGGNDNVLAIHDAAFGLQHKIPAHQAAVKALAWCPFQSNLLATGGGTADRCIKFWNTVTGACTNSIDTGSQARTLARAQPPGRRPLQRRCRFCRAVPSRCLQGLNADPSSSPNAPPNHHHHHSRACDRSARCSGTATSARSCRPTATPRTSCACGSTPPWARWRR